MILKNLKIYKNGLIQKGAILIANGKIKSIQLTKNNENINKLKDENDDNKEINCRNKLVLPGIIDIHSHLRDMDQCEKETFLTGTLAAAFSGITTVFNMPNTKPPAITADQVRKWMERAKNNIYVDVAFIAGVPKGINYEEIIKIIDLGVIGFKIYPLNPLSGIDWTDALNIQKILNISSKFKIPIFIHPDWPLSQERKEEIFEDDILQLHNDLYPNDMEAKYVDFIIENYYKFISDNNLDVKDYPIIHFCHISCKESYSLIKKTIKNYANLKISFEITPHHLFLSNKIKLKNKNFGKVLPPLRDKEHSTFLFNELKKGNINLIGTDHAPHTIKEKLKNYFEAPSGFPGFETYALLLLNEVCHYKLSLDIFTKITSENPAIQFNLKNKGFIREGYDADLIIIDKIPEYVISPRKFKSKAKFSPYENFSTVIQIWKVFLRGKEINIENSLPKGKIIKRQI
ncbi:MAG: dihydroorotase [Promethearchaeota archaeon]